MERRDSALSRIEETIGRSKNGPFTERKGFGQDRDHRRYPGEFSLFTGERGTSVGGTSVRRTSVGGSGVRGGRG